MIKENQTRRKFISDLTLGTIGAIGASSIFRDKISTIENFKRDNQDSVIQLRDQAPDGQVLKAGLVGCGGRGTGAAVDFYDAGPNLEIIALGDVFEDQLRKCQKTLKVARNIIVPEENCFVGIDSFEKVIDSGVDVVLFATPPHFRPEHVKAALDADKHIFQEKPVAVDPVGARLMMENTEKAKQKKLCMVSGTNRRYSKDYIEIQRRVANGEIGEIVSAHAIRNGGALWWVERKPEWSDMEYMLRNWGNFNWLSGDTIVEMFIHEVDIINWHIGKNPMKAIGYGGRQQRVSGDQYDHFSIVYEYDDGRLFTANHRTISGCDNKRVQKVVGTEGYADAAGALYSHDGDVIWEYPYPDEDDPDQTWRVNNPRVQEHVELVTAIRTGNYYNDSEAQVNSTRMVIMGRMAAYTGRDVTWEEILNSNLRLGPDSYQLGPEKGISEKPPIPGRPSPPSDRYASI
jgi:myo-inositol 2-dehydrogenase / D-chiro-inositol 1-dehydrogenase